MQAHHFMPALRAPGNGAAAWGRFLLALSAALACLASAGGRSPAQALDAAANPAPPPAVAPAPAPAAPYGRRNIVAAVFPSRPFVIRGDDDSRPTGLAVDIWEEIAGELGWRIEYRWFHHLPDLLAAVRDGKADVAVLNLGASHERAQYLKLSYPWYDSGLRILAPKREGFSLWSALAKYQHYHLYLLIGVIFVVVALILFILRRAKDPDFTKDWKSGLSICILNAIESGVDGKMEQEHLGWLGNVFFIVWLLFGVGAVAYFTSSMTSAMTAESFGPLAIAGLADLPGKRVGVIEGSSAEIYAAGLELPVTGYPELIDAVNALKGDKLDAVVADAPMLEYFVAQDPKAGLLVTGELFHPEKYCFAAGYGRAELMDEVSVEITRLRETQRLEHLRHSYFTETEEENSEEGMPWLQPE